MIKSWALKDQRFIQECKGVIVGMQQSYWKLKYWALWKKTSLSQSVLWRDGCGKENWASSQSDSIQWGGRPRKSVMGLSQNLVEQSANDGGVEILYSVYHFCLSSGNVCLGKYDWPVGGRGVLGSWPRRFTIGVMVRISWPHSCEKKCRAVVLKGQLPWQQHCNNCKIVRNVNCWVPAQIYWNRNCGVGAQKYIF